MMEPTVSSPASTIRSIITLCSIIAGTFLVSIATGMTAIIIPSVLEQHKLSGIEIGMMMALFLVAIPPLSLFLPSLLRIVGMRSVFIVSTVLRGYSLWAFSHYNDILHWAWLLIIHGIGEFCFLFLVQLWIGFLSFKKGNGFILSLLGIAISVGVAVSAFVISILKKMGIDLYVAMAFISMSAFIPIFFSMLWTPRLEKPAPLNVVEFIKHSPLVMAAALVIGLQMMGIQYLLVIYGTRADLNMEEASFLLSSFMLGPLVFEVTLASLSDKFDRRNVLMAGTFLSLICAIYLPLAIYYPYVAYCLLFLWGGIIGGLYSISLAILRDRYQGSELAPATGIFTALFGIGGIIGVIAIGILMDLFDSTDALPSATNIANFIFFCFAANRYIKALSSKEKVA